MDVNIRDIDALLAVSPTALAAYARTAGWRQAGEYGEHSNFYVGEELPEIIVPRTEHLGDYANVVSALIQAFAEVTGQDELTTYRSLVTADRDVVRVRAGGNDDGTVTLNDGVDLIGGTRDLLLAAACSLGAPQPVYRAGANREAANLLNRMHLGQTDQGSFVVTLLTPVVEPPISQLIPDPDDWNAPIERRTTKRLVEALTAASRAAEKAATGDGNAFTSDTLASGVSANLCEALAKIIAPFPTLDVAVTWARTRPMATPNTIVRFERTDAVRLRKAAHSLRERERLHGFVKTLKRGKAEEEGTISLEIDIDGQLQSVDAVLKHADYERALQAHKNRALVVVTGRLECIGERWWRLLNPQIERVVHEEE